VDAERHDWGSSLDRQKVVLLDHGATHAGDKRSETA